MKERRSRYFDATSITAMFGFSLYWAWLDLTIIKPFVSQPVSIETLQNHWINYFSLAVTIAVFAFIAIFRKDIARYLLQHRAAIICLGSAGALGILLAAIADVVGLVSIVIGMVLIIASATALILIWGDIYAHDRGGRGSTWAPGSIALSLIVYFVISNIAVIPGMVITALLPTVSITLALWLNDQVSIQKPGTNETVPLARVPKLLPWKFALLLFSYSFFFGVMVNLYALPGTELFHSDNQIQIIARGITCLIFFFGMSAFSWKPRVAYRIAMLIIVAGFLALPFLFAEFGFVIGIIANIGYGCFDSMMWAVLFGLIKKTGQAPAIAISIARMMTAGGTLAGALAVLVVNNYLQLDLDQLTALSSSMVYLMVVMLMLVLNEGKAGGIWGAMDQASGNGDASIKRTLAVFSEKYLFTTREKEVLFALVQGRSMPYIAKSLVISENTVKSHVQHIYQKANVHNKQELLDMIEVEKYIIENEMGFQC